MYQSGVVTAVAACHIACASSPVPDACEHYPMEEPPRHHHIRAQQTGMRCEVCLVSAPSPTHVAVCRKDSEYGKGRQSGKRKQGALDSDEPPHARCHGAIVDFPTSADSTGDAMTVEAMHCRRSAKSNTSNKIATPIAQRKVPRVAPPINRQKWNTCFMFAVAGSNTRSKRHQVCVPVRYILFEEKHGLSSQHTHRMYPIAATTRFTFIL